MSTRWVGGRGRGVLPPPSQVGQAVHAVCMAANMAGCSLAWMIPATAVVVRLNATAATNEACSPSFPFLRRT